MIHQVPKKGRLFEKVLKLLAGAGLDFDRPERQDVAECKNAQVTIVFLPAADIARYVAEGSWRMMSGIERLEPLLFAAIFSHNDE